MNPTRLTSGQDVPTPPILAPLLVGILLATAPLAAAGADISVERSENAVQIDRRSAAPASQRVRPDALILHSTRVDEVRKPALPAVPVSTAPHIAAQEAPPGRIPSANALAPRDERYGAELAALGGLDAAGALALPAAHIVRIGHEVEGRRDGGGALLLGWLSIQRQQPDAALAWFERAARWGRQGEAQRGKDQALFALATAAALSGDRARALQAVRGLADTDRATAMESLGWQLMDAGRPAEAAMYFADIGTEAAVFGRVLALRASAGTGEAGRLACDEAGRSERVARLCADALSEALIAAGEAGRHTEVLALGRTLETRGMARFDLEPMIAWSALRSGDAAAAAGRFERLLSNTDDPGTAFGLIESLRAMGDDARLAAMAAKFPAVGRILQGELRDRAFSRKQFDLAERLDPQHQTAPGRRPWAVDAGIEMSRTSGEPGLGRLFTLTQRLGVEGMVGELRIRAEAQSATLRTGQADRTADLGLRPIGPDAHDPLEGDTTALARVSARWEGPDLTLFGSVGSSPMGGAVSARTIGDLGLTWYRDPFSVTAQVFRRIVGPSLLAYSGALDPVEGKRWGGVVERGAAVLGVWAPGEAISAALGAEWAELEGRDVADNRRYKLSASLAYDLRPEGFDYLRVGPLVLVSSYQRNLSHFTYGHGGYYSPQSNVQAGLLFDALTAENQRQQWRAVGTVLHGRAVEEDVPRFPGHAADAGRYDGATTRGLSAELRVQWARLIAPQLIVGAYAGVSSASDYDHLHAGVMLRVPFEPRSSIVSADLPIADSGTRR